MSKAKTSLKNSSFELIQNFIQNLPTVYAFIDNQKKITSFNSQFKNSFKEKRLKGRKVFELFSIDENSLERLNETDTPITIQDKKGEGSYIIYANYHNHKKIGYSVTNAINIPFNIRFKDNINLYEKPLFQKEWENILSLLIQDISLEDLTNEILKQSTEITHCSWGIVIFNEETSRQQTEFKQIDDNNLIRDKDSLIPEIISNMSYITEWFRINKKILNVTPNEKDKIAGGIFREENIENSIMVPCSIENKIIAILILAKIKGIFTQTELENIEQLSSVFAFAMSFTIAKKLNDTLENKLLQSQKLETLGKLAGGMAHDFNNLLSSIFGSLNLLKKKLADRQDVIYLIDNIENCSIRATDLTKGLLNYGKPTPKRKTLIKPAELMHELNKVILQTFPVNIKIENLIDADLYDIMGNSTEIYQVLMNLCINAKEAINGNGQINIEAKNFLVDEKNSFDFPLLHKGKYVCFSVSDTGEGINEDNLSKIFDPYFSTKKKDTGSGLGLYVTYGIVKAHNGLIEVTSKLNQGTCFDIYIPAFEKPRVIEKVRTEKIILLADDEIMLRDLLAELLESYDYQVICVQNGLEVLRVLTEEIKVDLLIVDYNMPEMDGITCINKIKEIKLNVPIILSTGSASASNDLEIEKLKVDYILTKPYEFEQMLEIVQKLI
jgi:signal transduction histidine kinase/CheY-like chemotaxis protein